MLILVPVVMRPADTLAGTPAAPVVGGGFITVIAQKHPAAEHRTRDVGRHEEAAQRHDAGERGTVAAHAHHAEALRGTCTRRRRINPGTPRKLTHPS